MFSSLEWSIVSTSSRTEWPKSRFRVISVQHLLDNKPVPENLLQTITTSSTYGIISRFSSLSRMLRTVATEYECDAYVPYMRRFCKAALKQSVSYGTISRLELEHALVIVIRLTQKTHFSSLFKQLRSSSGVDRKFWILSRRDAIR